MSDQRLKCKSKRQFATEQEANDFARRMKQEAYQCSVCRKWHLTTGILGRITKARKGGSRAMRRRLQPPNNHRLKGPQMTATTLSRRTFFAAMATVATLPALPIEPVGRPWAARAEELWQATNSHYSDFEAWEEWADSDEMPDDIFDRIDLYVAHCRFYDGEPTHA